MTAMRRGILALTLALAASGLWAPQAHAFQQIVIDAGGPGSAWGKAVGDIDGDRRKDLVVGGVGPSRPGLYWYRNPGWGKAAIDAAARIGTDIEVADVNRDGRADVAVIYRVGARYGLAWYENMGGGAWRRHMVDADKELHDIEAGDLDGDGRPDVVGRSQGGGGRALHVWRQTTAAGGWAYSRVGLPEGGEGLLAVDLDRDRKPDIAVGKYWLKNVSRPGGVAFRRYTYNPAAPANAYLAAGTIDGDGRIDLVVSPAEHAGRYGRVSWFQAPAGPTAGTWAERVIESGVECVVHFVGVADFDRDGRDDVVTAMMQQGRNPKIKAYYNRDGTGGFGPPTIVAHTSSHSMRIIDINNDGWPSLFGADWDRSPRTPIRLWRRP
jgi:hypothetical protein